MGLEMVEITLEVEDTFGILVTDESATQARTVGQLHQYILEYRRRGREQGARLRGP